MVINLSPYCHSFLGKPRLSGMVALSNQAVIGKVEIPSPGLSPQLRYISAVFRLISSSVNSLELQYKYISPVLRLISSFVS